VPTYQYACTECGEQLEKVQKFSDDPLTVCPSCTGRLRKVFSPVGIVFKGSGFYRTDSRSGSNGPLTGKDSVSQDGAGQDGGKDGKDKANSGSKSGSSSSDKSDKSSAKSGSSSSSGKDSPASSSSSAGKSSGSPSEKVA
jgi:putative FmdB family regulatory protein